MPSGDEIERHALRVPEQMGETVRRMLLQGGVLDTNYRIERENGYLFFPLKEGAEWRSLLQIERISAEVLEEESHTFARIKRHSGDYRDYLIDIPSELKEHLPTSFDSVGDIALIKLPEELQPISKKIGVAMLRAHKHLAAVFQDYGVVGEFRLRKLQHLAGENRTLTLHTEFGVRLKVDIAQVYFTPRLAGERHRIAENVQDGERVLDMFAGVGPFSIAIAKAAPGATIHAIDLNPKAFHLLKENIHLNGVKNVFPHHGDAEKLAILLANAGAFNRIIMNLPHKALNFLEVALKCIERGTIHIYDIAEREGIEMHRSYIKRVVKDTGHQLLSLKTRELKGYSPVESMFVHQLKINREIGR